MLSCRRTYVNIRVVLGCLTVSAIIKVPAGRRRLRAADAGTAKLDNPRPTPAYLKNRLLTEENMADKGIKPSIFTDGGLR